ncbi:trafficking kinesin-binding protein 1 isoform X2 [Eucyclogobius newberryi]|uniref:trafficking kinesin-binding protein 1 isoform X2 n=1 Tax=Eucyclogobius newberryi TaxID=166745 RepID=UPI003B5B1D08
MNVCNSTDLPELEIISLLEEQLPVYKLRADTIFGYDQDDWLHTPLVDPSSPLDLTTEQTEETLKYFLLCADRVGQMTKTYNDIDAVTRLLEEKERDLELAARIGQSLLKKNKGLSERNELLEEQVEHIREEVSQLRHDLSMKDELLQFYTSAAEESEGESTTSTPVRAPETSVSPPTFFPLDSLQKKLKDLEEENKSLRSEANHLETETISYEEKEQQLVNDCVKELRDANRQIGSIAEELAKKTEDATRQQEEITHLLSQIVDLQKKAKGYAVENEELTQHLGAAKDAQRQLTAELQELQDKYAECMEMLHEAQEELKNFRNKTLPLSTPRRFHSLGLFPLDSLAAEIEGTMRKGLQNDDPDVEEQRLQPKRVFQTVKNMNLMRQQRSSLAPSPLNIPGSNQTSSFNSGRSSREGTPCCNSVLGSDTGSGIILDNRTGSFLEASDNGSEDSNKRPPGTPGTPGSKDLEAALRRLSLRRDNYLSEKRFFEDERERKMAYLAKDDEKVDGEGSGGPGTPTESLFSLCTHPSIGSVWSGYSFTARSYLPEKLQIVKPLEGSATLHAWQQLAQPHLGGLLDHRPGVVTKGFRTLDHEPEQDSWQLDQPEEDEVYCDSFNLSGDGSVVDLTHTTSSSSAYCNQNGTIKDHLETIQDGHAVHKPPPSSPLSSSDMNGHLDLMELQALQPGEVGRLSANFPGKCMSQTSSTYTFTTCRIMHPSDQLTSVSPSSSLGSYQSSACLGTPTHTVPFSTTLTPSYTPSFTPRRLSLSLPLAESSTNQRDSTRTTSTSFGLVRLLQEQRISASVYDPHRGHGGMDSSTASTPLADRTALKLEDGQPVNRPSSLLLMPSNSPHSYSTSTTLPDTRPLFQFSPCQEEPPYCDIFLASKPARTILREILGESEREWAAQEDDDGQMETSNLRLVDKLKRFRTLSPVSASSGSAALLAPFSSTNLANGALGGGLTGYNAGLRRNRSYPALVGASMAMKDPGGTDIFIPQTTASIELQDASKSHTNPTLFSTQSREHVQIEQATRRKTRPNLILQDSVDSEDEFGA